MEQNDLTDIVIDMIIELRTKAGLSARKLSTMLNNRSENYITLLETRRTFLPPLETLFEILHCCKSSPKEFFAGSAVTAYFSKFNRVTLS
jgi:transcriptional regulator with XRE-family HTH domain